MLQHVREADEVEDQAAGGDRGWETLVAEEVRRRERGSLEAWRGWNERLVRCKREKGCDETTMEEEEFRDSIYLGVISIRLLNYLKQILWNFQNSYKQILKVLYGNEF